MTQSNITKSYCGLNGLAVSWIWCLGMVLLAVVPFLSNLRTGPLSSFYLEIASLFFAVVLAVLTMLTQSYRVALPSTSMFFIVLAVLLMVQARMMPLPYVSQSDLTATVFLGMALLAWTARAWVLRIGQHRAITILAWAILAGVLLQTIVCVLQFTGETHWLSSILVQTKNHNVNGQLAQRNHLGHYLMWGVLSLCYLWHERRINPWLALCLMLWITGIMGLVGSRTIMAYLLAIGVSLVFWYWRVDNKSNILRLCVIIGSALLAILLFQLTLSPLMDYLLHINFQSAAERLSDNQFAQSGRQMEWKKAWAIFQNAPVFGHGWGSYTIEGFWQNSVYPLGFRQYESRVLFTHCHNLILQLLAETGLVGLVVVAGGFAWCVRGYFHRPVKAASVLMVSMMLVSLCHSLLEYPLWYVYFLAVFVLFMALTPAEAEAEDRSKAPLWLNWQRCGSIGLCLLVLVGMGYSMVWYRQLLKVQNTMPNAGINQINRLQTLRARTYLLRYYVDMVLVNKIGRMGNQPIPSWGEQAALTAGLYRPYSDTFVRGLYLAHNQHIADAQAWVTQMAHYYPVMMPGFLKQTAVQPEAPMLLPALQDACWTYRARTDGKVTLRCSPKNR